MLEIRGLIKKFDNQCVLDGLDLTVPEGKIVSIIGPSGCGKTTLLRMIAGLSKPDSGSIKHTYHTLGYVFQEDRLMPWLTVADNIKLVSKGLSDDTLFHLLERMALSEHALKKPAELSGGMRQRVSMARAFAINPDFVLLDEPFKSIDQFLKRQLILDMLSIWREGGQTMLMVTHDLEEALCMSDVIYCLGGKPARVVKRVDIQKPREVTPEESNAVKRQLQQFWEDIQ